MESGVGLRCEDVPYGSVIVDEKRHVAAHLPLLDAPGIQVGATPLVARAVGNGTDGPRSGDRVCRALRVARADRPLSGVRPLGLHELERAGRTVRHGESRAGVVVSAPLALEMEDHHVLPGSRRLDDLRTLEYAFLLDVVTFRVRHLEGDPLVLPRHEVARRVASDADLRAVAGLSADLVLAVPVPRVAVPQKPAAVRIDVHAVGVVPDAAVGQRVRRRRKKRRSNENFSLHAVDYTKARNCDASPFLWDASPAPQTRVSGP